MISNYVATIKRHFETNPLTQQWKMLDANTILAKQFLEHIKLVEVVMIHILELVED